jgi:hypothetical protein
MRGGRCHGPGFGTPQVRRPERRADKAEAKAVTADAVLTRFAQHRGPATWATAQARRANSYGDRATDSMVASPKAAKARVSVT